MEYTHGRGHDFLCSHTGYERHVEFPVEALRGENGLDGFSHAADIALLLLFLMRERLVMRKIAQCPHDDTCHEDDTSHLFEILLSFLPRMAGDGFRRRPTIRGQFHHEGSVLALDDERREQFADDDRHEDAYHIKRDHDPRPILQREERAGNHDIDRQSRRTTHERKYHHGDKARAFALDGSCGHDGRNVASKAHDERYERFAVEPHLVHELIHDEGCARHISRILHQRDEEIENKNLWQEDDDRPHATDYSIDNHRP